MENKEIKILLETGSVTFVGHYRRDLEKTNWHYYETALGDILHFRKDKMLAVLERPSFNHIEVTL